MAKDKKDIVEKPTQKVPVPVHNDRAENWLELARHFQVKVQKRTSEVTFLQTKAGFLIAAGIIAFQVLLGTPDPRNGLEVGLFITGAVVIFASLIVSIISMHISKATSALNPDKMILDLTERPQMTQEELGKWLAKSYAATNNRFNDEYRKKYNLQIISAILLLVALLVIVVLKGVKFYG